MFGGSERAPGSQRRRNGPIVRPNVDRRHIEEKCGLCKVKSDARISTEKHHVQEIPCALASPSDRVAWPRSVSVAMRFRTIRRPAAKPSVQFPKRNEPARRFVPKHQAHASQALTQSEPADIGKIGVLA